VKAANSDGTFNHFEMKGGTFEGWLSNLNEAICRAERSAGTGVEMDSHDINGTCVLTGVLDDLTHRLNRLHEGMTKYRTEAFEITK